MAFVTRVAGSGSNQRTPWAYVTPSSVGSVEQALCDLVLRHVYDAESASEDAVVRASSVVWKSEIELTRVVTLDTGTTAAGAYCFIGRVGAASRNKWFIAIVIEARFSAYDEAAQDAAATASFTISIGTSRYTATEGEDGVTFDSDVLTRSGSNYFALMFMDPRSVANVIEDMYDDLKPAT